MSVARRMLAGAALGFALPLVFLLFYRHSFGAPASAVGAHLAVVAALLLALALMRLLLDARAAFRWLAAPLLAITVLTAAAYYGLVLAGLQFWGRVVSWTLIRSYARQLPTLLDTLGLPWVAAAVLLALAFLLLTALAALWLRRGDWTALLRQRIAPPWRAALMLAGIALLGVATGAFLRWPPLASQEPLALTLFGERGARDLQGHALDPLAEARRDRAEDAARAAYRPAPPAHPANLVLIVVDALRPDHMSLYGYTRPTTPNLDALARTGVVQALPPLHASCGDSACGLLSLLSSKTPQQFSQRPFTLLQALQRNGYRVALLLSGDHTHFYGLRDVYGAVDQYVDGGSAEPRRMNDDRLLLERLRALPPWDGRPVMLQLHLMSAHTLGLREAQYRRYLPASNYASPGHWAPRGLVGADPEAVNYYDNGVLQADAVIAAALAALQGKGYLERARVVITGDHGEMLGEHRRYSHANGVYEEELRVPLAMIRYGTAPGPPPRATACGSQVDIAPTLMTLLGLPLPAGWSGAPLQQEPGPRTLRFEEGQEQGLIECGTPDTWKYWQDARRHAEHVYELRADPGEQSDLIAQAPPETLRRWRLARLAAAPSAR